MPRQPNKPLSKGSQEQKLSWEPKATKSVETEGMIQQELGLCCVSVYIE